MMNHYCTKKSNCLCKAYANNSTYCVIIMDNTEKRKCSSMVTRSFESSCGGSVHQGRDYDQLTSLLDHAFPDNNIWEKKVLGF